MVRVSSFCAASLLATAGLFSAGCSTAPAHDHEHGANNASDPHAGMMMHGKMALATFTPTQGNSVRGLVMFHEMDGHLMAHVQLTGLAPNSEHGFHLHDKGDCASADGTSAGGHFNPDGQPHGPQSAAHHAGDLPSLKADANGVVDQKLMLSGPSLADGPSSIVGRSVIVHANADDYTTQPTGNSGPRIACGVIAAHGH
jgi:Cu-Zn family superoxide dismutase